MVERKKVTDESGTIDLVMTYSTLGYKLKQEETGVIYGKDCIDVIAGYDESNIPYSRFTYTETGEKDDDDPETDIPIEAEATTETGQKAAAFDYLTGRSESSE